MPHIDTLIASTMLPSTTTNQMIARTLMSLSSWCVSTFSRLPCGPACGCADMSVPSFVRMREHVLEVRIVDRDQRPLAQLAGEQEQPQPAERQRDADVGQADREASFLVERGRDEPDHVVETNRDDEPRDPRQEVRAPLQILREQQAERQRE